MALFLYNVLLKRFLKIRTLKHEKHILTHFLKRKISLMDVKIHENKYVCQDCDNGHGGSGGVLRWLKTRNQAHFSA